MPISRLKIEDRLLLKKACKDGCRDSLVEIHHKYGSYIFNYLKKRAPNRDTAEDILQEVFRQILEGKCDYNGVGDPQNYLVGVAGKLLKKELSKERNVGSTVLSNDFVDLFADHNYRDPIERLQKIELGQDLKAAVSRLPSELKEAVELVYMSDRTYTKAAEESGCKYDTMRKRIKYALDKLKNEKLFSDITLLK